jgi:hypothetical protein
MKATRAIGSVAAGLVLAIGIAACAGPGGPVTAEGAERIYRTRCALCHPAWTPSDFSPDEWPFWVDKYAPRAGLTPDERDAVLAYLVREAGSR